MAITEYNSSTLLFNLPFSILRGVTASYYFGLYFVVYVSSFSIDYASVLTIHKRRDGSGMRSYSDGDRDSDEDGNQLLLDADQPRSKIHGTMIFSLDI